MPLQIKNNPSAVHNTPDNGGRNRFGTGVLTGIVAGILVALALVELGLVTPSPTNYLTDSNTTKNLETSIAALRSDLAQLELKLRSNELIASGQSSPATGAQPSKTMRSDTTDAGKASAQLVDDSAKYNQIRANLQQMPFSRNYTLQDLTQDMATLPADRQRELLSELTSMMNSGQLRPEAAYRMR